MNVTTAPILGDYKYASGTLNDWLHSVTNIDSVLQLTCKQNSMRSVSKARILYVDVHIRCSLNQSSPALLLDCAALLQSELLWVAGFGQTGKNYNHRSSASSLLHIKAAIEARLSTSCSVRACPNLMKFDSLAQR